MMKRKILALIFDYLIIFLFVIVFFLISGSISGIYTGFMMEAGKSIDGEKIDFFFKLLGYLSLNIFCFLYYSHIFKRTGQTIGERLMKIKIVPVRGEKISALAGILRTIFLAPLLAIIGLIPVSRTPYKSLLDHISLTKTEKSE